MNLELNIEWRNMLRIMRAHYPDVTVMDTHQHRFYRDYNYMFYLKPLLAHYDASTDSVYTMNWKVNVKFNSEAGYTLFMLTYGEYRK